MRLPIPEYQMPLNPFFDWLGGRLLVGFCCLLVVCVAITAFAVGLERLRFERVKDRRPGLVAAVEKSVRFRGRYGTQRAY